MASSNVAPDVDETAFQVFARSFAMIIFSEIGDKTFLIAAILAMRHPRLVVFAGAFASLVVMSFLSAELGNLLPTLLPRRWTQFSAAILFFVFGAKMLQEARTMRPDKMEEEMKEAEEDIEGDEARADGTSSMVEGGVEAIPLEEVEEGGRPEAHVRTLSVSSNGSTRARKAKSAAMEYADAMRNFCSFFLGPVFVQSFVLTFLGEWGDRSQISTIALAAAHVSPHTFTAANLHSWTLLQECLPRNLRYRHRAFMLYRTCGHRRSLRLHQNLRQTRYDLS